MMAKGKHAASKTARDLRAAEARIEELEATLTRERDEAHEREQELHQTVQNLKGRLVSEVDEEVDRRTAAAHAEYAAEVEALENQHRADALEAFRLIVTECPGFRMPFDGYRRLSQLLDVDMGEMVSMDPNATLNRTGRRMTAKKAKLYEEVGRQGLL